MVEEELEVLVNREVEEAILETLLLEVLMVIKNMNGRTNMHRIIKPKELMVLMLKEKDT